MMLPKYRITKVILVTVGAQSSVVPPCLCPALVSSSWRNRSQTKEKRNRTKTWSWSPLIRLDPFLPALPRYRNETRWPHQPSLAPSSRFRRNQPSPATEPTNSPAGTLSLSVLSKTLAGEIQKTTKKRCPSLRISSSLSLWFSLFPSTISPEEVET